MAQRTLILLALACCAGCAHVPASNDAKSATWATAVDPAARPAPYHDDLDPNSPLVTSSGLECEHCNVAEFSR